MARTVTGLTCGTDTKIAMIALRRKQIFSVLWLVAKISGFFRYVSFKLKKNIYLTLKFKIMITPLFFKL